MNCPIDPETLEISGIRRIEEAIETLDSLKESKVVIGSHQGRVGNNEYIGMDKHAKVLEKLMGRKIKYVEDAIGEAAQNAIKNLEDGEILLLDNLRLCAEENYEFTPENAAKTIMVSRLSKLFEEYKKGHSQEILRELITILVKLNVNKENRERIEKLFE
mgnify:CR=1 FL=1